MKFKRRSPHTGMVNVECDHSCIKNQLGESSHILICEYASRLVKTRIFGFVIKYLCWHSIFNIYLYGMSVYIYAFHVQITVAFIKSAQSDKPNL